MKDIEIFEDIADIEEKLNTDISSGLSRREAGKRAAEDGRDGTSFFVRKKRRFLSCFFGVVKMLPAAILTLVAVAAFFMGRSRLAIAVLSTFISGSIVSGMLYLSAQRSSERMEIYSNPTARVLRDGKEYLTDCRNLVVGDVVILRAGDFVPCDMCPVQSVELCVSEIGFDGEVIYSDREINEEFDGGERLLAGSFVKSGYAIAVVCATGNDTRMSPHIRAGGLAKKNSDPVIIKRTYKYLSGFVFILSVIALVLAIVGMFTAKHTGILENFLMYLSLILSMTLVSSPIAGRILLSSMIKTASRRRGGDYAAIKNNLAIDILPNITDAVICGLSGICDGEKYFSGAYLSGTTVDGISSIDREAFIFECIYSYIRARKEDGSDFSDDSAMLDGLMNCLIRSGFDTDAADVRIKSLYFGAVMEGFSVACIETANQNFRVYIGRDLSVLDVCDSARENGGLRRVDAAYLEGVQKYADGAGARGENSYAVVSEVNGEIILEGIIGLREGVCDSIGEIRDALAKKGVRISAVISDANEYNRFYLSAAGFEDDCIFDASEGDIPLNSSACAYMGYTPDKYAELVRRMRAAGRTVALIGVSDEYSEVYDAADIIVSYDNINYGSHNFAESEVLYSATDGSDSSRRCSQKLRTRSDVIISRGSTESGGLRGFYEAVRCAESFSFNYMQMMLLFVSVEAVLVLMTFMTFISGIPMISYPAILLLVVAAVFFSVAAFSTFKQRSFISERKLSEMYFKRQVVRKIIPPTVASLICFGVAIYLDISGYIMDMAAIPLATTLGVILTFILSFGGSMRACIGKKIDMSDIKGFAQKEKKRTGLLNIAAMTLVLTSVVRMIFTALLFPGMAVEYGYVGICSETFILLGVYFAAFALSALIIRFVRMIIKHK